MTSHNTTKEQILMSDKKRKNVGGQPFFVWCSTLTLHTRNPATRFSDETATMRSGGFSILIDVYNLQCSINSKRQNVYTNEGRNE